MAKDAFLQSSRATTKNKRTGITPEMVFNSFIDFTDPKRMVSLSDRNPDIFRPMSCVMSGSAE